MTFIKKDIRIKATLRFFKKKKEAERTGTFIM